MQRCLNLQLFRRSLSLYNIVGQAQANYYLFGLWLKYQDGGHLQLTLEDGRSTHYIDYFSSCCDLAYSSQLGNVDFCSNVVLQRIDVLLKVNYYLFQIHHLHPHRHIPLLLLVNYWCHCSQRWVD